MEIKDTLYSITFVAKAWIIFQKPAIQFTATKITNKIVPQEELVLLTLNHIAQLTHTTVQIIKATYKPCNHTALAKSYHPVTSPTLAMTSSPHTLQNN
jgi:hypothetical protein